MTRISILFLFTIFGCTSSVSEENLDLLNGYWEIEEVIFPDGRTKDYNVNTSIDFILVKDKKGYRKKVQPKLNGTYDTSNDADPFVILERDGLFTISYNSENNDGLLAQRSEELINISENKFSVRNTDGLIYIYKRFEPINIKH